MIPARTLLAAVALGASAGYAAPVFDNSSRYQLVDTYDASNWFEKFDTLAIPDPTHGSVEYVSYEEATSLGLAAIKGNQVYMGVDYKTRNVDINRGRKSMRVSSKKSYTKALIAGDIVHMPTTSKLGCGIWPAFWTFGPDWPNRGEVDIVEGVNSLTTNQVTLHTSAGCDVTNTGADPRTMLQGTDCTGNDGCPQISSDTQSYNQGFNELGGGVYIMEWTDQAISVWLVKRVDVQRLIGDTAPDPARLGAPMARFTGSGCDFSRHFENHNIIFDITFCGDWAEPAFRADPKCRMLAPTCQRYVAGNPADFAETFWMINSVKVYQIGNSTRSAALA